MLSRKGLVSKLLKVVHFFAAIGIFAACWLRFYRMPIALDAMFMLFGAVIYFLLAHIYKAYDLGYSRVMDLIYSHVLTGVLSGGVIYVVYCMVTVQIQNPLPILLIIALQACWDVLWALVANRIYYTMNVPKRTVVVYRNRADLARLNGIRNFEYKFRIEKFIENPGDDFFTLLKELEGFEAVFVVGVHATLRNGIAKYCVENRVAGYFAPHVGDIIISGAVPIHAFGLPVQEVRRKSASLEYMIAKRLFDIAASLAALIVLSPVMLIIALAIKLGDGGPVFYKQTRCTKDGKLFGILKFRSMRVDAEKDGVARLASDNDDRITPVGKFIRACRIDELPQLINILKGDMSIVGPRPERPEIAAEYEKTLPAFQLRLQVKAGLTGYAQVYGRYNTEPYDKLQMDLIYINRMSFVEDLKIIFATIKILFIKESTQGVAEGQVTAVQEDREKSA